MRENLLMSSVPARGTMATGSQEMACLSQESQLRHLGHCLAYLQPSNILPHRSKPGGGLPNFSAPSSTFLPPKEQKKLQAEVGSAPGLLTTAAQVPRRHLNHLNDPNSLCDQFQHCMGRSLES